MKRILSNVTQNSAAWLLMSSELEPWVGAVRGSTDLCAKEKKRLEV